MATKAEREWFRKLQDFGCVVCFLYGTPGTPPEIHHCHKNGRRVDHFHTIPLCPAHHRTGEGGVIPRHPRKRAFEAEYGTEWELWEITKREVSR
jgi:hypothetical protein